MPAGAAISYGATISPYAAGRPTAAAGGHLNPHVLRHVIRFDADGVEYRPTAEVSISPVSVAAVVMTTPSPHHVAHSGVQ